MRGEKKTKELLRQKVGILRKFDDKKGITLIVLVIAIIVMTILACISISMTVGDNGITTNAMEAARLEDITEVKDKIELTLINMNQGIYTVKDILEVGKEVTGNEVDKDKKTVQTAKGNEVDLSEIFNNAYSDLIGPMVTISTATKSSQIVVTVTASDESGIAYYEYYLDGTLIKSTSDDSYTYEGLASGTEYTIKVIVYDDSENSNETETEVSVNTTIAVANIKSNPETYYGEVVNYTVGDSDLQENLDSEGIEWQIFYADDSYIYLITSDYVPVENAPSSSVGSPIYDSTSYPYGLYLNNVYLAYDGASNITDSNLVKWNTLYLSTYPDSGNINMKCVAYLMDTSLWSDYTNTNYATYAMGGATLEMWIASWNEKGYTQLYCNNVNSYGYYVGKSSSPTSMLQIVKSTSLSNSGYDDILYFPHQNYTDKTNCYGYWLASPSAYIDSGLMYVRYAGNIFLDGNECYEIGFRPVVCLSSGVELVKSSGDYYEIVN